MGVELREPLLVKQIEQLAIQATKPPEVILEDAVRAYLETQDQEAIHAETTAFWAQHNDLVRAYGDQYVAMYQSQVVDHDRDVVNLEIRVRERFGVLPVLIAPLSPTLRREIYWRGGRIDPSAGAT